MHLRRLCASLIALLAALTLAGIALAATPTNSVVPSITGYAHVGYTLTAAKGTWAGASAYAYQWQSSNDNGSTWSDIDGATKSTYKVVLGDTGNDLRVSVVATSSKKEASAAVHSTKTADVSNVAPVNVTKPEITAAYLHVGYAIKATAGTWDAPTVTAKYQWQLCDASGANCADIAKATSSSYTLISADAGLELRVDVTPTNSVKQTASDPTYSLVTAAVGNAAPANSVKPVIAGYVHTSYTLTATPGTWDAPKPSAAYQWQLCDSSGANCADIAKATASTFKVPTADAGSKLRVGVTATNAAKQASSTVYSSVTAAIGQAAPAIVDAPAITGNAFVGQTLTTTAGTWDAPKPTVAFQWYGCADSDGTNCVLIPGATKSTYKLLDAQSTEYIEVGVKATNVEKATSETTFSDTTAAVSGGQGKPANTAAPTIAGSAPKVGDTLTAAHGTWTGTPTPTFTYQWLRCATTTPAGANKTTGCTSISTATATTYTLVSADLGKEIRVTVTATNFVGKVSATSDVTAAVGAQGAPANSAVPTITGTAQSGSALTHVAGTWSNSPTVTVQWQTSANGTSGWTNITGATSTTYIVQAGDIGNYLRVEEKAVNSGSPNGITADSSATAQVTDVPSTPIVSQVNVTGGNAVGDVMTADVTASGSPTPTITYIWMTCTNPSSLQTCNPTGGTDSTYTVQAGDVGLYIGVIVYATNSQGQGYLGGHTSSPATS